MINSYTTYDNVRALLGVNEYELPDSALESPSYAFKLNRALAAVKGTLAPDTEERDLAGHYKYLVGLASRTDDQNNLYWLIGTYSAYVTAHEAGVSLSMYAKKTESDGKSLNTRFSAESTFKSVLERIEQEKMSLLTAIKETLGVSSGTGGVLTMLKAAKPAIDRVTGSAPA